MGLDESEIRLLLVDEHELDLWFHQSLAQNFSQCLQKYVLGKQDF